MKRTLALTLAFCLMALLTPAQENTPPSERSYAGTTNALPLPQDLPWLNTDQRYSLEDLRGKIILLDFWTYCCINCIHVLPDLKKLEQEFPELVVIGVHSAKFTNEREVENIRQAILRYGIEHPVIVDNAFTLWQGYGIRAWPSFALIDPAGKFVGTTSGEGIYERLQLVIQSLSTEFAAKGLLNKERITFELERSTTPESYLAYPGKIDADSASCRLFITDANHNRILITNPQGEVLHVIGSGQQGTADGSFATASFFRPQGLVFDPSSNILYIADTENHLIRAANLDNQTVTTLLGTGQQSHTFSSTASGTQDAINSPWDLELLNGQLYIAMAGPHQIWRMDLATNKAEVFAGSGRENIVDGTRLDAALAQPSGIVAGPDGTLYFADSEVSALRKIENGQVKTLIGEGLFEFGDKDGTYPNARLQHCIGVHYHQGKLYIADTYNHKIRVYEPATGQLSSLIGTGERGRVDGPAAMAQLNEPNDIAFLDGIFYIADTNNDLIRTYDPETGRVGTFAIQQPQNISMLAAQLAKPDYRLPIFADAITSEARAIDPSQPVVLLGIQLPEGYKLNTAAPNYVQQDGQPPVEQGFEQVGQVVRLTLPVTLSQDQTTLRIEAGLYYCENDNEARCLIKQLQFELPITRQAGAQPPILTYRLPLPEETGAGF